MVSKTTGLKLAFVDDVVVWVSADDVGVAHRSKDCAPPNAQARGAAIRESDCCGDYAVQPEPPWHVLGTLCGCGALQDAAESLLA